MYLIKKDIVPHEVDVDKIDLSFIHLFWNH